MASMWKAWSRSVEPAGSSVTSSRAVRSTSGGTYAATARSASATTSAGKSSSTPFSARTAASPARACSIGTVTLHTFTATGRT